jgi:hypothetical protein
MADKDFRVKNKLHVNGLSQTSGVILATNNALDAHTNVPTQYGGTGTTTSPSAGQILYSASGSTYAPASPYIIPGIYQRGNTASRPASPAVGDLYYNTELNYFESYTSNGWFPIAAAPLAPTGVTATNQGSGRAFNNGQASVAFSPNTSGGAPTSFIVTPSPSTSPTTFTGSSSPITVTGLASSTQYTYTVQSTSPYGTSAASAASAGVTATTVPQAPTLSATAGDTVANITITPGATGGSSITQYSITSNPATTTQTTSNVSYTFTGLTNGTAYTFTATATNSNGTSLSSSASNSITPEVLDPGAMVPLGEFTLASAQSTITFSNIPQTYQHLQIRLNAREEGAASNAGQQMAFRFNSDSGDNYSLHRLFGNGATVLSDGYTSNITSIRVSGLSGGLTTANVFSGGIVDVLDYLNTNKRKTVRSLVGADLNDTNGFIFFSSGCWENTAAITSLTITATSGANFTANSSFALYGVKA